MPKTITLTGIRGSGGCSVERRKKATRLVKAIVRAADRGDCERAAQMLASEEAMRASQCMRVVGFSRVARRVHECMRRMGHPRYRGQRVSLGRRR